MKILPKYIIIVITCSYIFITSCDSDHGIAPKPVLNSFGFGGNIVFYGSWPDSIKRMYLVALKDTGNFVVTNFRYVSLELPLGVPALPFSSLDSAYVPLVPDENPPSNYHYVVVVQQSTDSLSWRRKDWFVTGIYYENNDTTVPGTLTIPENTFVNNINIYCDFNNPPNQPPGGN